MSSVFSRLFSPFRRQPRSPASKRGKHLIKAVIVVVTGWLLIVAGVAGLVLPIIPGTILVVVGVMLLSRHNSRARRLLAASRKRYPQVWRSIHSYRSRLKRFWMRLKERFHPKRQTEPDRITR
ncbi:MAG TPA: PGPGW domain-containing protein [Candidatus Angelobacter sp.]